MLFRLVLPLILLTFGLGQPTSAVGTVKAVKSHVKTNAHGDRLTVSEVTVSFASSDEVVTVEGGTVDGVTMAVDGDPVPAIGKKVKKTHGGKRLSGSDHFTVSGHTWALAAVPYSVNPVTPDLSESAVLAAIQSSALAWSTQVVPNVRFTYAGRISGGVIANNRHNDVFFRAGSAADGSNAIATTYWWYDSTTHLIDADVIFYDAYRFFTGESCSGGYFIEDVATHEFGHALGLRHSLVNDATMVSGTGACNSSKRSLAPDDIVGILSLYGGRPAVPCVTGVTLS